MPIWAPFRLPNGSQNGTRKASETTTAPREPQRPFKSLQKASNINLWEQEREARVLLRLDVHGCIYSTCPIPTALVRILAFRLCIYFASLPIPKKSQLGSIWDPKQLSGGRPIASGPGFQRMPRVNRFFVPFGSLKKRFKDPSWDSFGSHGGLQNASFWARFLNVV